MVRTRHERRRTGPHRSACRRTSGACSRSRSRLRARPRRRTSSSGGNPNKGEFTIRWKPAPTLRARFTLQHQNAEKGGWTTVASNLSQREFTFKPEAEGTWNYRVKESNETGESGYSTRIRSDQGRPHGAEHAHGARRTREPGLRGQRRLVQGHALRSPSPPTATRRWPTAAPRAASNPSSLTLAENVQHQRDSHELRHSGRQSRQRLRRSLHDGAGRRDGAVARRRTARRPPCRAKTCSATVTASDGESGLASDPSGTVPIDTSKTGPFTVTRTADRQRRPRNDEVVHDRSRLPDARGADAHRRGNPNNGHFKLDLDRRQPGAPTSG